MVFAWRELRKVTKDLTLHYERKLYLLLDTPHNRRLAGKYIEFFQFPDGRIEIRVAGQSLPYSVYNKLGHIDPVEVVDNKRLGHTLEVVKHVQAKRDDRVVRVPSTAHRADGSMVPRNRIVDSKRQRELSADDLSEAVTMVERRASDALPASDRLSQAFGSKFMEQLKEVQADIST